MDKKKQAVKSSGKKCLGKILLISSSVLACHLFLATEAQVAVAQEQSAKETAVAGKQSLGAITSVEKGQE